MASKLVISPWRKIFERFISTTRNDLRIAAPFYSDDMVKFILNNTGKKVSKYFLLALSERAIQTGAQSTTAIRMLHDDISCQVKFVKNLHAKFLVADHSNAVVTSSNLTNAGVDSNVEMGIWVDGRNLVRELIQRFDWLWNRSETISKTDLAEYDDFQPKPHESREGKSFGKLVQFKKLPKNVPAIDKAAMGWILIHSSKVYGMGKTFNTPQDELASYNDLDGQKWHWILPRPLKAGGPYILLLAYKQKVFGQVGAFVTHDTNRDERQRFNFAFKLRNYKRFKREIPFSELPLGKRIHYHRSLIKLDERILATCQKLNA